MPPRSSPQADDERQDNEAPRGPEPRSDAEPDSDRIARRAYERFQARGGEHGRDQEDWFEAEREFRQPGTE